MANFERTGLASFSGPSTSSNISSSNISSSNISSSYGNLFVFELGRPLTDWREGADTYLSCHGVALPEGATLQATMEKAAIYPSNEAVDRLQTGREAFVAQVRQPNVGQVMATYGWVARSIEPLGDSGSAFDPPAGDVWLYDFATVPSYRRRGYYPALLRFILAQLAAEGVGRAWIGTKPGNHTSARAILRAGFYKIADMLYVPPQPNHPVRFEMLPVPGVPANLARLTRQTARVLLPAELVNFQVQAQIQVQAAPTSMGMR